MEQVRAATSNGIFRNRLLLSLVCFAALPVGSFAGAQASAPDPLLFPKEDFKLETKMVKTADGEKTVSYRLYQHIPYVTRPVDKEYESLDVKVPVSIDGVSVQADHAPVLFVVGVGGYMSASNYKQRGPGGPDGPGRPGLPGGPNGPGPFTGPEGRPRENRHQTAAEPRSCHFLQFISRRNYRENAATFAYFSANEERFSATQPRWRRTQSCAKRSPQKFPANREIYREFRRLSPPIWVLRAISHVNSERSSRAPITHPVIGTGY